VRDLDCDPAAKAAIDGDMDFDPCPDAQQSLNLIWSECIAQIREIEPWRVNRAPFGSGMGDRRAAIIKSIARQLRQLPTAAQLAEIAALGGIWVRSR
jgi:hypothetical protein